MKNGPLNIYRILKPGNGWVQLGEAGSFETSKEPNSACIIWQIRQIIIGDVS